MKINLFIIDNSTQNSLVTFFTSIKKIKLVFQNISFLKNCKNDNNLILVPPETKKNYLIKSINKFKLFKLTNTCYLIPTVFLAETKSNKIKSILYPITINHFENELIEFFFKIKYSYKNFNLIDNNFLLNSANNRQVYLTEIESKIIKLLFENVQVLKTTINSDVLSQQPGVESQSLEAHLYRLRKKMQNLGGGKIISDGEKSIKIK